jgi:predicted metalloprotease with PDZ domain
VAGTDLSDFFARYVHGTDELDYAAALEVAGLALVPAHEPVAAALRAPAPPEAGPARPPPTEVRAGMHLRVESGRISVVQVLAGSPAYRAGINAGDELVAMDGFRVGFEPQLVQRLGEKKPGERVRFTLFRRDELLQVDMEVESGPPDRLQVRVVPSPTEAQRRVLEDWLRNDVDAPVEARATGADGPAAG